MAMHEFNKLKKLSEIISMNEYQDHLEDVLWEGNVMIDEGFYLEVYINPDGIDDDTSNGHSYYKHINNEITFEELVNLKQFSQGSFRKMTMTINIIPDQNEQFQEKRNLCENIH